MFFTEIIVVVCTLTTTRCTDYVDVMLGNLSVAACQQAIQQIAREYTSTGTVLMPERSHCTLLPISTQLDLES
jgi:hypothetical protein